MENKTSIISKVFFSLSAVLFAIFAGTVFFAGQKVGGAIFFMIFATEVAFAFLDKKYRTNNVDLYRYSVCLADATNILAVGTIIYHGQDIAFMIATISLLGVSLVVDIIAKLIDKSRFESKLARLLNCLFMVVIFPYFFAAEYKLVLPIIAVVTAAVVLVLKVVLAVVPKGTGKNQEIKEQSEELEQSVSVSRDSEHSVE